MTIRVAPLKLRNPGEGGVQSYPEATRSDGGWLARDQYGVTLFVPDWDVLPSPVVPDGPPVTSLDAPARLPAQPAKEKRRGTKSADRTE